MKWLYLYNAPVNDFEFLLIRALPGMTKAVLKVTWSK